MTEFLNQFIENPVAQIVGIIAMCLAVISFQQRTQKRIMIFQTACDTLFIVHYFLLGAFMGGVLNSINIVRGVVFAQRNQKKWARNPIFIYIFSAGYILSYILLFTVFNKEPTLPNLLLEALPLVGSIIMTFGFQMKEAKKVRLMYAIGSPMWLCYNLFTNSIGGTITETFNLISILIGYLRLDRKKDK